MGGESLPFNNSFEKPHLSYRKQLLPPMSKKDEFKLEQVQRNASKMSREEKSLVKRPHSINTPPG